MCNIGRVAKVLFAKVQSQLNSLISADNDVKPMYRASLPVCFRFAAGCLQ